MCAERLIFPNFLNYLSVHINEAYKHFMQYSLGHTENRNFKKQPASCKILRKTKIDIGKLALLNFLRKSEEVGNFLSFKIFPFLSSVCVKNTPEIGLQFTVTFFISGPKLKLLMNQKTENSV